MSNLNQNSADTASLDELFVRFNQYVVSLSDAAWKTRLIAGLAISAALITLSSVLYFLKVNQWVCTLVGSPAGVLLFLVGLALVYRTKAGEWGVFQLRQRRSFRARLRYIVLGFIIFAAIFIPFGTFIPYGLGGSVLMIVVLSALTFGRRTRYESQLLTNGLPDPRDLVDEPADTTLLNEEQPEPPIDPSQSASGRIR